MSLAKQLIDRGFIHQFSTSTLEEIVDGEKRNIYHGIDPTADSAHIGNLVIWMLLKHLLQDGHKIVFLVGGGTGMIGDPKPDVERQLRSREDVVENTEKIKTQAQAFFGEEGIEFVDNYEWLKELTLLDFLRDVGKHYTVNELIKKDAVATRLNSETGLSYTEFAYPILQGYDFYQLFLTKKCTVQVGGSDQWGNMISGVELVRRKLQEEVFVVTAPLVLDKSTGKKFGKSEGNAVWLDPNKTSPYKFYQFWLNVSDENVFDYLRLFTLLPLQEIEELRRGLELNPGKRVAQQKLASLVTGLVHGEEKALSAGKVSKVLFGEAVLEGLTSEEWEMILETAPTIKVRVGLPLMDTLLDAGLATSKREARTFIESGAVELNGLKITMVDKQIDQTDFQQGVALLKRGKKQISLLTLE